MIYTKLFVSASHGILGGRIFWLQMGTSLSVTAGGVAGTLYFWMKP
jgi:hypothetical protein